MQILMARLVPLLGPPSRKYVVLWLVSVFTLMALAVSGFEIPALLVALDLFAGLAVAVRTLIPASDRRAIAGIVIGGTALRLVVGAALLFFLREQVFVIFDDTVRYEEIGRAMAGSWHAGHAFDLYGQYRLTVAGYYYVVAALYFLSGDVPMLIIVFNAVLAGLTSVVLYLLASAFHLRRTERIGAVALATFIPSVVFWSSMPLKDTFVTFALACGLLAAFRLRRPDGWALAVLSVAILVTASLRLYVIFFLAIAAGLVIVVDGVWRRRPVWSLATLVLIVILELYSLQGPVGALIKLAATDLGELERQRDLYGQGGSGLISLNERTTTPPKQSAPVVTTAPARTTGSSVVPGSRTPGPSGTRAPTPSPSPSPSPLAFPSGAAAAASPSASSTPAAGIQRYLEFAAQVPSFFAQFFIQPIPFVTRGSLVTVALPEMFLWYLAIPLVFVGLLEIWRRDRVAAVVTVMVTIGMALIYGTIVANAGSLMRYRAPTLVLLTIPIAVGASELWRRYRTR